MIRLQTLSMANFRGVREGKIEDLTDLNILVGRNNSGKTTVIEAIQRLATRGGFGTDSLGRKLDDFWRTVHAPAVSDDLMWFRQDKTKELVCAGTIIETTNPNSVEEFTYQLPKRREQRSKVAHEEAGSAIETKRKEAFFSAFTILRPQDAFNQQIEQMFWPKLLSDRRDKMLTATLNEVFGLQAESFQLLPSNQLMVLFEDYSLPLDSQGDGTRAALRTMMTLAMMRGTLLMLEEPESHQHPGSLERFSTAICRLAKSHDVQIIVSTHSEECVRSFLKGANTAESEAAVFHLTLNDGTQEARRLDAEAVETLNSTGIDVRLLDLYA